MFRFHPEAFEPPVSTLLESEPLNELGPGRPHESLRGILSSLNADIILGGGAVSDSDMAQCCVAGLWLLFDFLDESHQISQDIKTATGSYWHGIMHRREPDYSNAKYWFRQVGDHEVFGPLCEETRELTESEPHDRDAEFLAKQDAWDPYRFIDLCEAVARGRSSSEQLCRRVAQLEWRLLFYYCVRRAAGR